MSPSVLTETVWALAIGQKSRVPDRVVVLTTSEGQKSLVRDLFCADRGLGGWERLRLALKTRGLAGAGRLQFGPAADHVRLFPSPSGASDLADIATSADNLAAADFILRELRAFTENPATTVLASIAGGRKTMSALLMSCMSILGREQDRVLHVLVNQPYDTPLDPPFLFPERGVRHQSRDGKWYRSCGARVDLIDVPFVRMRGWYEGTFKSAPPGYVELVAGIQRQTPAPRNYPGLLFDRATGRLLIDNRVDVQLSATEFGALALLLSSDSSADAIIRSLQAFKQNSLAPATPEWQHALKESSRFHGDNPLEDLRKTLSSARAKIKRIPGMESLTDKVIPLRGRPPGYPAGKIAFSGSDPFADVRGYPK
jgi:CRISPR-associated protein (TIGR02584 family)